MSVRLFIIFEIHILPHTIYLTAVLFSSLCRCIHGTCQPINSYSYSCRCQPGFTGVLCDTPDQETANPCSLARCKHGKCRVSGLGNAYCECNSGYTGEACDRGEKASFSSFSLPEVTFQFPATNIYHNCCFYNKQGAWLASQR